MSPRGVRGAGHSYPTTPPRTAPPCRQRPVSGAALSPGPCGGPRRLGAALPSGQRTRARLRPFRVRAISLTVSSDTRSAYRLPRPVRSTSRFSPLVTACPCRLRPSTSTKVFNLVPGRPISGARPSALRSWSAPARGRRPRFRSALLFARGRPPVKLATRDSRGSISRRFAQTWRCTGW